MSDNLLIEVINSFQTVTPEQKRTITKIQGLSYGNLVHQVIGEYKSSVSMDKGRFICMITNGFKMKSLRKIFDRETGLTIKNYEKDGILSLFAIPCFQFNPNNGQTTWWYELSLEQDRDRVFDMKKVPIQVSITDFDNREWKNGIQLIPVRFTLYRSKGGNMGFNYTAISEKQGNGSNPLSSQPSDDIPY